MTPTPETDQNIVEFDDGRGYVTADFARLLEIDRNRWKANHDNQVRLKRILTDRPDLKDRASRMQEVFKLIDEYVDAKEKFDVRQHPTVVGLVAAHDLLQEKYAELKKLRLLYEMSYADIEQYHNELQRTSWAFTDTYGLTRTFLMEKAEKENRDLTQTERRWLNDNLPF